MSTAIIMNRHFLGVKKITKKKHSRNKQKIWKINFFSFFHAPITKFKSDHRQFSILLHRSFRVSSFAPTVTKAMRQQLFAYHFFFAQFSKEQPGILMKQKTSDKYFIFDSSIWSFATDWCAQPIQLKNKRGEENE